MKKTIVISFLFVFSQLLIAQTKGDKYIAGSLSLSSGSQESELSTGSTSQTTSQPLGTSFEIQGELAYFVADNIRLSIAIGRPYFSNPESKDGDKWLFSKTAAVSINPNIAYYVKIAEKFYYTPEVGYSYSFGSYKEELTASTTYNADYRSSGIYGHIIAFEYRITEKIALGIMSGTIYSDSSKIKDKESNTFLKNDSLGFRINEGSIAVRLYF